MRKIFLAATMLSLVGGAAFAAGPQGWIAAGDANLATTSAGSNAGVQSSQGTYSNAGIRGNGAVVVGTVSGNYTSVNTGASAQAGPGGSYTNTSAQQMNVGGTVSGGMGQGRSFFGGGASGSTGGGQSSQASGTSSASANNANLGGFLGVTSYGGGNSHRHGGPR